MFAKRYKKLMVGMIYFILVVLVGLFLFADKKVQINFGYSFYAFVFFFVLPMIILRKGFNDNQDDYYWPKKYFKKQLIFSLVFVVVICLLFWLIVLQLRRIKGLELVNLSAETVLYWALKNLFILPVGLLAQEFFFRGFLFGLFRNNLNWVSASLLVSVLVGFLSTFLTQTFLSWWVYLGIFAVNLLLNFVVWRLRSVVFSFLIVWLLVLALNFAVIWRVLFF